MQQAGIPAGVELRGPATVTGRRLGGRFQEARCRCDLAVEVAGVERSTPHGFVDAAKPGDREQVTAERGGEWRVLELRSGALDTVAEDHVMVESQPGRFVQCVGHQLPAHAGCVTAGGRRREIG